jgi:hypothetical protein
MKTLMSIQDDYKTKIEELVKSVELAIEAAPKHRNVWCGAGIRELQTMFSFYNTIDRRNGKIFDDNLFRDAISKLIAMKRYGSFEP